MAAVSVGASTAVHLDVTPYKGTVYNNGTATLFFGPTSGVTKDNGIPIQPKGSWDRFPYSPWVIADTGATIDVRTDV